MGQGGSGTLLSYDDQCRDRMIIVRLTLWVTGWVSVWVTLWVIVWVTVWVTLWVTDWVTVWANVWVILWVILWVTLWVTVSVIVWNCRGNCLFVELNPPLWKLQFLIRIELQIWDKPYKKFTLAKSLLYKTRTSMKPRDVSKMAIRKNWFSIQFYRALQYHITKM